MQRSQSELPRLRLRGVLRFQMQTLGRQRRRSFGAAVRPAWLRRRPGWKSVKVGYSRSAWSELETGQVKHMTHEKNRQILKSIRYTIRLAQQGLSMGRAFEWLTSQRPAMVEILKEIERSSDYTSSESSRGDLTLLLAHLSHVAARGHQWAPPVNSSNATGLVALDKRWCDSAVARLGACRPSRAKNRGWLKRLKPDCVPLVERLANELEEVRASQRRVLEVAWGPAARVAVEYLFDHLESRIARRSNDEGDQTWGFEMPAALVVQEEVRTHDA